MSKHHMTATIWDRKGRLLSTASNSYTRSHPLQKHFAKLSGNPERIYLHAELAALLKCGTKQPHTISVVRIKKDGTTGLAKPCAAYQLALKHWGVKVINYTL